MTNYEIGRRIEERRKSLGLTLEDVASAVGVAKTTVRRYEQGSFDKLKLPIIEAIARVLDVNPAWLVGKDVSMTPGAPPRAITDDDLRFALFGDAGNITDADLQKVKEFAAFIKSGKG